MIERVVCRFDILGAPQDDMVLCEADVELPDSSPDATAVWDAPLAGPSAAPSLVPPNATPANAAPPHTIARRRAGQRWSALVRQRGRDGRRRLYPASVCARARLYCARSD